MSNTSKFITSLQEKKPLAFFFDMDGTLMDTMPAHTKAWEIVMKRHNIPFLPEDSYLQEGKTSLAMLTEFIQRFKHYVPTEEEAEAIYHEKTDLFHQFDNHNPIPHVYDVLKYVHDDLHAQVWVVTGSGMNDIVSRLEGHFPKIFQPDRVIGAHDVSHGKPNPEPYLKAWERCGLPKEQCCVVENAPLGIQAGKAADIFVAAVNTGILADDVYSHEEPDGFFANMLAFVDWLKKFA